jgi:RimJ/RimL family protein N-acetyltransferase
MFAWFNSHDQTHAWGHWFWLQSELRWGEKVEASRWALQEIAKVLGYPVLVGKTPSENRRAIDFMRAAGMTVAGEIPDMIYSRVKGHPVAATLLYFQREDPDEDENLHPDQDEH